MHARTLLVKTGRLTKTGGPINAGRLARTGRRPDLAAGGPALHVDGHIPAVDAGEVLAGRVVFRGLPPADLGTGEIDWLADPHRNRSWMLSLHALRWMGGLVLAYERTGRADCLDRAVHIARDWVRANRRGAARTGPWAWAEHPVALRAPVLVRLSAHVRDDWLARSLHEHGKVLADPALYRKGHNHGLDQDIALLTVGCRLGLDRWRDLAVRRMAASAELAVDDQGALWEQAPKYGIYVHRRLGAAIEAVRGSGAEVPPGLIARRGALEAYISHATQPDGRLVPIGDSPADQRPGRYRHQEPPVKVFGAGYVFGRTAWDDPGSAYYSIRFGPGRRFHGHEDHLGVTYHAHRRDILVEAGFHSYEKTGYREWTTSPEAHNVPVPEGAEFRPGTATRLTWFSDEHIRQRYRLTDIAYGVRRTRTVLVHHEADLMAVLDEVPEGSRLRSVWHLAPGLVPRSHRDGVLVFADGDWPVTLIQFTPGSREPVGGQTLEPGTISTGYLTTAENTTVLSPPAPALLTLIVPGCAEPEITWQRETLIVRTPGGSVPVNLARPQTALTRIRSRLLRRPEEPAPPRAHALTG
ncbi:heparinase II/III domain-containing protein [Rhizohabitans arisaemae]|uniref:heparinase II/III domain-containing protein n=1 Tax=Rhizohabitans arisaemae TaxID=2720610 RepID=UPI0024B0E11C|nr:heparinase II/III family protein [Rhizohabitans arisaemae]